MHWAPNLIWFNNHTSTCSVNYYVQKVFSNNAGTTLLKSSLDGAKIISHNEFKGKVGVGTWETSAKFDNVKVTDNETGKTLAEDTFTVDAPQTGGSEGLFSCDKCDLPNKGSCYG